MTTVGIRETDFLINNEPTYKGRFFEEQRIEGLLFNVRAVQATFDDANPETRPNWAYPDTGEWDAERNVRECCDALASWRDHGVLALTISVQGGGAIYRPDIYHNYDNNGYTPAGELKPEYAERIQQVIARADELGMVVILSMFYWVHMNKMEGETALWRAADATLKFLECTGYQNVLIELANEIEVVVNHTPYAIFEPENVHQMINALREDHPGFLYSTSQGGVDPDNNRCMPVPSLIQAVDFLLPHGNGARAHQIDAAMKAIQAMPAYQENPKPIMINEDSPAIPNLDAAWRNRVSWGYYDQGFGAEAGHNAYIDYSAHPREPEYENLSGFQTPPVNWTINTNEKRAFFRRVAEVTVAPQNSVMNKIS